MSRLKQFLVSSILANSSPTVTDDVSKGAYKGQRWLSGTSEWICTNPAVGAAVWTAVGSGGGGGGVATVTADESTIHADNTDPANPVLNVKALGIDTAELAALAVTTGKIAANAVTAAKLDAVCSTPGSFTSVDVTVTADGRITAIANGAGGGGGGASPGVAYEAAVAALPSLVSYWKCKEDVTATTAVDSGPGANPLTIATGLIPGTRDLFEGFGNALINNGTALGAHNASPSSLPVGNAARTVMCWMRTIAGGGASMNLVHYGTTGGSVACFDLGAGGNSAGDVMLYTGSGGSAFCSAGYKVNDGRWHHIVATYDGAGNLAIYVDGQPTGLTTGLTLATVLNGDGVQIMGNGSFTNPLTGGIEQVAITGAAMSAADVLALYKLASPASGGGGGSVDLNAAYDTAILAEASLITYCPMDELSGNFLDRKGSNDLVNAGGLRYNFPGPIAGKNGGAAWWAASGGTTSKAKCAGATGLPTGASPWTTEAWYKYASGAGGDTYLIYFGTASVRQAIAMAVQYSATANEIAGSTAGDDVIAGTGEGQPYTSDSQWHHIAVTYDGGTTLKLYWDGKLAATHTLGGALNIVIDATGLGVGDLTGSSNFIRGGVAKVAVYGATLTADQIRDHYNTAKLGFAPT